MNFYKEILFMTKTRFPNLNGVSQGNDYDDDNDASCCSVEHYYSIIMSKGER